MILYVAPKKSFITFPPVSRDVLGGKYRIEWILGVGGMGVVVAAHHLQLDEKVAHQVLAPRRRLEGAEAAARFEREARRR